MCDQDQKNFNGHTSKICGLRPEILYVWAWHVVWPSDKQYDGFRGGYVESLPFNHLNNHIFTTAMTMLNKLGRMVT